MYKDSKSTCTAIVLLIKPFVWRRSRCRRRRVLLKLPNREQESTTATAAATSLNKRFNEQNNSCASAL